MTIKLLNQEKSRQLWNLVFILPAFIIFILVVILPLCQGIPFSMTDWNGIGKDYSFIGLKNYLKLFKAKDLWGDIATTFKFTIGYIIGCNVVGLLFALLTRQSVKLNNVCRTLIFMPYVISMLTAAFVWKAIFNGIYVPVFNLPSPLAVPNQALIGIIIISVWRTSGYCMLIYVAALQTVPEEFYEAARIEGAGAFQRFFKITLPMIVPAITSNVSLILAWGFKVFDTPMAATGGGPGKATETMAMYVYNNIFGYMKAGYGQAAAVLMTIILLVLTVTTSKFLRSKEVEA